jgi:type II secretory pathway component PulF
MDDKLKEKVKQKLEEDQTLRIESSDDLRQAVKQKLQEERATEILEQELAPTVDDPEEPEKIWQAGVGRVSTVSLAQYFRELSVLLTAGFPLLRALRVIGHGQSHRLMSATMTQVAKQVEGGSALWRAMEQHPRVFPPIVVSTVRAGEASGTLEEALEYLSENLEYEAEVRTKVRSAFDYPIFFGFLTTVILAFMFLVVLPRFQEVYAQLSFAKDIRSPYFHTLLQIKQVFPWFLLFGSLICVFVWSAFRSRRFLALEKLKLRIPIFGRLLLISDLTRFSKTLSVQSRSSVPILESLRLCRLVVDNRELQNVVSEIETSVEQGGSIVGPLGRHPLIPRTMVDLVEVGEESGSLSITMNHLSKLFQAQIETMISRLTALMQPFLLLLMGGVVVVVFVGMLTPYFEVLDKLQMSGFGPGAVVTDSKNAKKAKPKPRKRKASWLKRFRQSRKQKAKKRATAPKAVTPKATAPKAATPKAATPKAATPRIAPKTAPKTAPKPTPAKR